MREESAYHGDTMPRQRHRGAAATPPLFPQPVHNTLWLNAEIREDLGFRFVHGKQVVTGRAVLRDG